MMTGTRLVSRHSVLPLGAERDRFADGTRSNFFTSFTDRFYVIRVAGWSKEKDFEIALTEAAAPPATTRTLVDEFTEQTESTDSTRYMPNTDDTYVFDGAHANTEDLITGSTEADSMSGLGGNEVLAGMGCGDLIDIDYGDDLLLGGVGTNTPPGGSGDGAYFRGLARGGSWIVVSLCLLGVTSSARGDWTALGAAYRCKAGQEFELRATVDTSNPDDPGTVRPERGFAPLRRDEPSRFSCGAGRSKVEAVIHVRSPKASGMCAGSGDVSVESLLVNGRPILRKQEPFNMSCPSGQAVVSVRVRGSRVRVCRGEWAWGKGYHSVKCNSTGG